VIHRFDPRAAVPHDDQRLPATDGAQAVGGTSAALLRRLEQLITAHPKQSLIAALTAGVLLGWISKRR
jgi:hypothetical protein